MGGRGVSLFSWFFLQEEAEGSRGSVLALVLILCTVVSILALGLMQLAMLELRTSQKYKIDQEVFYASRSGIEFGVAALNTGVKLSTPYEAKVNPENPGIGSYRLDKYDHTSDHEGSLPLGISCLSDLSANEVLLSSCGEVVYEGECRLLTTWALVERSPYYSRALVADKRLHLRGIAPPGEAVSDEGGVYGGVHTNHYLFIEGAPWSHRSIFHLLPETGDRAALTFSRQYPLPPESIWGEQYSPQLWVEVEDGKEGADFIPDEGGEEDGSYYLIFPNGEGSEKNPRNAGFEMVAPLNLDFISLQEEFLCRLRDTYGEEEIIEVPGGETWGKEEVDHFSGNVVKVSGDLTIDNTYNGESSYAPLEFDGVLVVDGNLDLRISILPGDGEQSGIFLKGVFFCNNFTVSPAESGEEVKTMGNYAPREGGNGNKEVPSAGVEMEGLVVAVEKFTVGAGGIEVPYGFVLRGTAMGSEVSVQGPYTLIYQACPEETVPEYAPFLPGQGWVKRQLFRPYITE